jgi:hypothetical protein
VRCLTGSSGGRRRGKGKGAILAALRGKMTELPVPLQYVCLILSDLCLVHTLKQDDPAWWWQALSGVSFAYVLIWFAEEIDLYLRQRRCGTSTARRGLMSLREMHRPSGSGCPPWLWWPGWVRVRMKRHKRCRRRERATFNGEVGEFT